MKKNQNLVVVVVKQYSNNTRASEQNIIIIITSTTAKTELVRSVSSIANSCSEYTLTFRYTQLIIN